MVKTGSNDEAESWFKLAEVLALLAGLFFAGVGFFLPGPYFAVTYISESIDLCSKFYNVTTVGAGGNLDPQIQNCLKEIRPVNDANLYVKISVFFLYLSIIIAVNSIIFWGIGRRKITNPEFEDTKKAWWVFIVDIIILIAIIIALCILK